MAEKAQRYQALADVAWQAVKDLEASHTHMRFPLGCPMLEQQTTQPNIFAAFEGAPDFQQHRKI